MSHPALVSLGANRREAEEQELDELCELLGVAKRSIPSNERSNERAQRHKQVRDIIGKRKAERLSEIEQRGWARVVEAAGRLGAIERPEGLAVLAGETFELGELVRVRNVTVGMRAFPAAGSSTGLVIPLEFLEPCERPEAPPALRTPTPPRPRARSPVADCPMSDASSDYPSYLARAWDVAVGDSRKRVGWMFRRNMHEDEGRPWPPSRRSRASPSGTGWCHPPGCMCNRSTCPVPVEERGVRMPVREPPGQPWSTMSPRPVQSLDEYMNMYM